VSSRIGILVTTVVLAACQDEFANAPLLTLAIDTTAGWHDTVTVTDVDTLQIKVALAGGASVTGVQVHWQSSNPAKLEVTPLEVQTGQEKDSLILELRTVITAHARDSAVIVTAIVDRPGFERRTVSRNITVMERWIAVSAGVRHSCGLTIGNDAYCWGSGLMGVGPFSAVKPKHVLGESKFRSVSAGGSALAAFSCGIVLDGRAFCWGTNSNGELGNGTTIAQLTPVAVAAPLLFESLQTAESFACGVATDVLNIRSYCWGLDHVGQLGTRDGLPLDACSSDVCSLVPRTIDFPVVQQGLPTSVALPLSAVAPGGVHTCGVFRTSSSVLRFATGTAACWGSLEGLVPGPSLSDTAVAVPGGLQFGAIASGESHTCAIGKFDRKVYCWGYDTYGQLGNDSLTTPCADNGRPCRTSPLKVTDGHSFTAISARGNATCGITTDSTALCWGSNAFGVLGTSASLPTCALNHCSEVPVMVELPGGGKVVVVSVGLDHACGVTSVGAAYCWGGGNNSTGGPGSKLGDGVPDNNRPTQLPVRVAEPI